MKKLFMPVAIVLCIMLTLTFTSCAQNGTVGTEEGNSEVVETVTEETLKVGLLLPDTINDQGWNAIAYAGLLMVEDNYDAEISYVEQVKQSDMEEQFRNYALQGFDIVFGHGFQYGDTALAIAADFPDTIFLINGSGVAQEPNVASVNVDNFQKGFLPGVIAGLITESNIVGGMGGFDIPSISICVDGFEAGAKYINPEIVVMTAMTGDNADGAKAKEVAYAMMDEGADVMMANLGPAAMAVVEAAEERGTLFIGTNADMNELAPDTVVTSGLADIPGAMNEVVGLIVNGGFVAQSYDLGIKEGVVALAPYHSFEETLDPAVLETVNDIIVDIMSGELDTSTFIE